MGQKERATFFTFAACIAHSSSCWGFHPSLLASCPDSPLLLLSGYHPSFLHLLSASGWNSPLSRTFQCLFEPAASEEGALSDGSSSAGAGASLSPQGHAFLLFAQLSLLLLVVKKRGSKDTCSQKTFHGLARRNSIQGQRFPTAVSKDCNSLISEFLLLSERKYNSSYCINVIIYFFEICLRHFFLKKLFFLFQKKN